MSNISNIYDNVLSFISNNENYQSMDENNKVLVINTISDYCKGASTVMNMPIDYFFNKITKINTIKFFSDEPEDLFTTNINYRSENFFKNNEYVIIINEASPDDKKYNLMHELTHFFINTELKDNNIVLRNIISENNNNRLNQGIIETVTQSIWDFVYPKKISYGFTKGLYLVEIQIVTILIDMMGKERFFSEIFKNPNIIMDKLKSIDYEGTNLFKYLEKQLDPLVKYRGVDEHKANFDILSSFQALSDCNKMLKLENRKGK